MDEDEIKTLLLKELTFTYLQDEVERVEKIRNSFEELWGFKEVKFDVIITSLKHIKDVYGERELDRWKEIRRVLIDADKSSN